MLAISDSIFPHSDAHGITPTWSEYTIAELYGCQWEQEDPLIGQQTST